MRNWFKRDDLSKIERQIVDNVDKHGCHVNAVFDPDGQGPTFAYSIGFAKTAERVGRAAVPEVIMFGLPNDVYGPAINELLAMTAGGFELAEGQRIEKFFGDYDCVVRLVHQSQISDDYLNSAIWYHQTQMDRELRDVAMIVWPDANGLFPWEDGCEAWVIADQPALYEPRLDS